MPMVLIRNIAKLSPAALFADVLIVSGLLILLAYDVYQIFFGHESGPMPGPNIQWLFNPSAYPVFVGTAVYSFEGIGKLFFFLLIQPVSTKDRYLNEPEFYHGAKKRDC